MKKGDVSEIVIIFMNAILKFAVASRDEMDNFEISSIFY